MYNEDFIRVLINGNEEDINNAEKALDESLIDWDYDSYDRFMLPSGQYQEASEIFDKLGLDYDII